MNWIVNLLLWGSILPLLPIEYHLMRNEIKFKKNIVVGVTLPHESRYHAGIKLRLDRYVRELKLIFLLLVLAAIPCIPVRPLGAAMFVWGIWILLVITLPYIPYIRCNRDLKVIKLENGWNYQPRDVLFVDTAAIPKEKWHSPWLFIPSVLLCLLPILWDRMLIWVYLLNGACALSCWLCYRYLYRNRAELVDADQELSQVLSHIRRRNWGKVWLYCAYSLAAVNLAMWLVIQNAVFGLVLILLLSALVVYAAVRIEFLTRRVQEKLTLESGKAWYTDEDDKWIWGLFYYNPNDTHSIINNRVGTNSTFNLARPAGKIFTGVTVIVLLSIPFMGFMFSGVGEKPLDLSVSDSMITASYSSSLYEVEIETIESVELLDQLPQGMNRVYGVGAEKLLMGRFRSNELGDITLCLDPQCPPFLLIKTTDGRQFLFGTRDPAVAETVLSRIPAAD